MGISFIKFETQKGEVVYINSEKIVATTPIRSPDEDGVIIMYGEREDCCSVVKGTLEQVMSKIELLTKEEDAN